MSDVKSRTGEFSAAAQILQSFSDFAVRAAFVFFLGSIVRFAENAGYCRENFMIFSGVLFLFTVCAGYRFSGKISFHLREVFLEALAVLSGVMLMTGHRNSGVMTAFLAAGLGCGFTFSGFCRKYEFLFWAVAFGLFALLKDIPWFLIGVGLLIFSGLSGSLLMRHSWKNWILPLIFFLCGAFFYVQILQYIPRSAPIAPDSGRAEQNRLALFYGLAQLPHYPDRVLYLTTSPAPEECTEAWKVFPEFKTEVLSSHDPEILLEKLSLCKSVPLILFDCPLPVSGLQSLCLSERMLNSLRQTLSPDGVLIVRFPVNRINRSERSWRTMKKIAEGQFLTLFREVKTPPGCGNVFLCGDHLCVEPEKLEKYNEEHSCANAVPPHLTEILQQDEPAMTAVSGEQEFSLMTLPWQYFLASEILPVSVENTITTAGHFLNRFRFLLIFLLLCAYFIIRYFRSGNLPQKKLFRSLEQGCYLGIFAGILLNRIPFAMTSSVWQTLLFASFFLALFCFQRKKPTFAQRCLALFLPWLWLLLIFFHETSGGMMIVFLVSWITAYAVGEALPETEKLSLISGGCFGVILTTLLLLTVNGILVVCLIAMICALLTFLPLKQES